MAVTFPPHICIEGGIIKIDLEKPYENIIQIENIDYIPYYLDNDNPGNKGGNSHILKLVSAQDFDEDEGYPRVPDQVIKICKLWIDRFEKPKSKRFKREIDAIRNCTQENVPNVIRIENFGQASIANQQKRTSKHWFYTMPFADNDLSSFLSQNNLSLLVRVELCLEICRSLAQIWKSGYYHRDIKPDNILFLGGYWVMSDLGLAHHREEDIELELEPRGEWIGPRGWMSPESMNKYLCEKAPWAVLYDSKIDHRSDIFQLGKVLWYILQGNSPIGGIRRNDFKWKNDDLYQVIRTMLNHSKIRRQLNIGDVINSLERIQKKLERKGIPELLY
jgi:serine/threonine protein kinase